MQKNYKVIIIGSAYPFRGGGISTYNERLAKAFQDRGDSVQIYTFSLQYPSFLFPGKTQYSTEAPPPDLDIKIAVNSINPFNWIRIGREIAELRPDLVIVRYWMPFMAPCLGSISGIIRRNRHTKVIAITDNIIPHEKMPGGEWLSRYFVKRCDAFITMSKAVLADLGNLDSSKPRRYHPHPLYDNFGASIPKEEAKRNLGLEPEYSYLLFFGFIREYKGLDLLLKAFADSRLRKYPLKLLIAGEFYIDSAPYIDMIKSLGLSDLVVLHTQFIPNTEIVNYFCASDIVVQPYKEATQSGVTQVAYHFDKPMITTNVGGLSEMVPDGKVGYVVEPEIEDLSLSLIKYFEEKKEIEFTENVKEEKKRFSWDLLIDQIYQLYDEL
ncbi:MAG: glycosyltransferase [Bacteroidales bacterium]|nr:glycosyltransferase [Bacteroidales bacterium]